MWRTPSDVRDPQFTNVPAKAALPAALAPAPEVCGRIASETDVTAESAVTREKLSGSTNPVTTL